MRLLLRKALWDYDSREAGVPEPQHTWGCRERTVITEDRERRSKEDLDPKYMSVLRPGIALVTHKCTLCDKQAAIRSQRRPRWVTCVKVALWRSGGDQGSLGLYNAPLFCKTVPTCPTFLLCTAIANLARLGPCRRVDKLWYETPRGSDQTMCFVRCGVENLRDYRAGFAQMPAGEENEI